MVDIVFVTADKGLCGAFNMTTIKAVIKLMDTFKKQGVKVRIRGIGKKGVQYFGFNDIELLDKTIDLSSSPSYEKAAEFITKATSDYVNGMTDKVILVHNGFKNMISQELKIRDLLPIDISECSVGDSLSLMEVEPEEGESEVLEELAQKYIEYGMYFSLIDSLAAEHSARMQAMDAATNNAKDLVKSLSVQYNKARQEAITKELIEINTGIEAMK
jgi:F-type H+-transporting ATPase subunit gamma